MRARPQTQMIPSAHTGMPDESAAVSEDAEVSSGLLVLPVVTSISLGGVANESAAVSKVSSGVLVLPLISSATLGGVAAADWDAVLPVSIVVVVVAGAEVVCSEVLGVAVGTEVGSEGRVYRQTAPIG